MILDSTADVVVIGAGVQGLSAAYNIQLGAKRRTILIETYALPGRGSSGRSGSMLMKSRENRPKIALSLYSYDRFENFRAEFGEELSFRKTGFLSAVPPSHAERYLGEHELRLQMGAPSERLTPAEVQKLCPGLRTDDLAFGILGPDDGEICANQILTAYARAAAALGVELCFEERAIGLRMKSNRVCGVVTTRREIACETVVNAAGADASEVSRWAGVSVPLKNRRRSLYFGTTSAEAFNTGPMVEDAALEWYYRPLGDNRVLVGMGLEPEASPTDGPNMAFLPEVRIAARHRAPLLADFEVTGGSSGIRPLTDDILPIVGPVPEAHGLILSCGWGGEGIMHSPAGGSLVADWVNDTNTCPIERNQFLLERFSTSTKERIP